MESNRGIEVPRSLSGYLPVDTRHIVVKDALNVEALLIGFIKRERSVFHRTQVYKVVYTDELASEKLSSTMVHVYVIGVSSY